MDGPKVHRFHLCGMEVIVAHLLPQSLRATKRIECNLAVQQFSFRFANDHDTSDGNAHFRSFSAKIYDFCWNMRMKYERKNHRKLCKI